MKILWTGTDSLLLVCWPPSLKRKRVYHVANRLFARIADLFVECHFAASPRVKSNLHRFGMKKPVVLYGGSPVKYPDPVKKRPHAEFNVLFYKPALANWKLRDWLYGVDIYRKVRKELKGVHWIVVDGSQHMTSIYAITDFYFRPTRHDGDSRIIRECKINNIPYYHGTSIEKAIRMIQLNKDRV